ncbi:unnamed protein product [Trifolium pratense]|uniref:Uncharacterized protein n=1 Tax=Trifolium pratense TaxID=57577 RepID=A0ACB0J3Z7_TRIPR|nr:unnamed protein product [Trifolium pratense]
MDPSRIEVSDEWFQPDFRNEEPIVNNNQARLVAELWLNKLEQDVMNGNGCLSLNNRRILTEEEIGEILQEEEPEAAPPEAPANGGEEK